MPARDEPSFDKPNWWQHVGNEARAMARGCGLSEMTTYGKFRVTGPQSLAFLDHVCSAKVPETPGRMALALLLNDRGGIIGDVTVLNHGGGSFYLVGASLGVAVYHRWMRDHSSDFDVAIDDITDSYAALGIAGPNSRDLLNALSGSAFDDFPFMHGRDVEIGRISCLALRVSYSGELGWELHCPMASQKPLFEHIMAHGAGHGLTLMGSRAMAMLRLEKGYRSWGAELTSEVTPHAAGLQRFCAKSKHYIGKRAIDRERQEPPTKRYVTLAVDPAAPPCWGTEPVLRNVKLLGYVTSGGMGWRIDQPLAVAWIDSTGVTIGDRLEVQVLNQTYPAQVVADPIYDPDNARLLG